MLPSPLPFLTEPSFWASFLFGFVTIFLYSKEKFSKPTYDMKAMGPFASLPLDALTLGDQYKQGQRTYLTLILALYAALCFIGPITFGDSTLSKSFDDAAAAAGSSIAKTVGVAFPKDVALWPAIAAAFLVAAGATNDQSLLGRIEFGIRRYAHRTAYIPAVVQDLARSLREVDPKAWLESQEGDPAKIERSIILGQGIPNYLKPAFVDYTNGKRATADLILWLRVAIADLLLTEIDREYDPTLLRRSDIWSKSGSHEDPFKETKKEFDALKKATDELPDGAPFSEQIRRDANKFLRSASLLISLLVTLACDSATDRKRQAKRLGFEDTFRHHRTDSAFKSNVIFIVAIVTAIFIFASGLIWVFKNDVPIGGAYFLNYVFSLLFLFIAFVVSFLVLHRERENALEAGEWTESRSSYAMSGLRAALLGTALCFAVITLISPFLGLSVWNGLSGLVFVLLLQFLSVGATVWFGFQYYRFAARIGPSPVSPSSGSGLRFENAWAKASGTQAEESASSIEHNATFIRSDATRRLIRRTALAVCLVHAVVAASLTGASAYLGISNDVHERPSTHLKEALRALDSFSKDPKNNGSKRYADATTALTKMAGALGTATNPNYGNFIDDLDKACDNVSTNFSSVNGQGQTPVVTTSAVSSSSPSIPSGCNRLFSAKQDYDQAPQIQQLVATLTRLRGSLEQLAPWRAYAIFISEESMRNESLEFRRLFNKFNSLMKYGDISFGAIGLELDIIIERIENKPSEQPDGLAEIVKELRKQLKPYAPHWSGFVPAAMASFLMALGFGAALLVNRTWWLWTFENRPYADLATSLASYGLPSDWDAKTLAKEDERIGALSRIEALQYESYRETLIAHEKQKRNGGDTAVNTAQNAVPSGA